MDDSRNPRTRTCICALARSYRWRIAVLLFFATTINYVDRMVFGILAPKFIEDFHWTNEDYAHIVFWFEVAYAVGLAVSGRLLDWIGTRTGFSVSLGGWSLVAALHGVVSTITGFSVARFFLGLTESAVFPAAVKTTAEWFPPKERALVAGIFNAGSSVGAVLAPLLVPWIYAHCGWRWTFVLTGSAGGIWLLFWLRIYQTPARHPRVSASELACIEGDVPEVVASRSLSLGWIVGHWQTWSFIIPKFLTDAVWRWYLYLLPIFFSQAFHLEIREFGLPFFIIYCMADLGSVAGGGISSWLIGAGWSTNAARKTAMLASTLCVVPVVFVPHVSNLWSAVFLIGLATGGHQGLHSNLFAAVSDMFPKRAVASVVGLGGTAGALGAMTLLGITARMFHQDTAGSQNVESFTPLFLIAGVTYLLAMATVQILAPRLAPVEARSGPICLDHKT